MRKIDPVKVQKQRERIIRSALKCFARKGVHGTSTDDICRAARISPGTLYYYFKSRDGLIHDVIVHAYATRDAAIGNLAEAPNLLDAMLEANATALRAVASQGVTAEVHLELVAYASRNKAAQTAFFDATRSGLEIITAAVRAHQAAGKLPSHLSAESLTLLFSIANLGIPIMEITDDAFSPQEYRDQVGELIFGKADAPPS